MLEKVKLALRIKTTVFDSEIEDLIESGKMDLKTFAGVEIKENDFLIERAICTYCKMNFGDPVNYDKLKDSYDEQKAQLLLSSEYGRDSRG